MTTEKKFELPPRGGNPSSAAEGTNPGSFARPGRRRNALYLQLPGYAGHARAVGQDGLGLHARRLDASKPTARWHPPEGFDAGHPARTCTPRHRDRPEMTTRRRARAAPHARAGARRGRRGPHGHPGQPGPPRATPSTRCASVARARPRSTPTWAPRPSRAAPTKRSRSSLGRALGRRHRDGPLDGRRSRRHPRGDHPSNSTVPIGTVPIYSMIIGRTHRGPRRARSSSTRSSTRRARASTTSPSTRGVLREHLPLVEERLIGIVSRGGSLLAKWMLHHGAGEPDVRALGRHLRRDAPLRRLVLDRRRPAPRRPRRRHRRGAARRALDPRRAHRARLATRRAGHGRGPRATCPSTRSNTT